MVTKIKIISPFSVGIARPEPHSRKQPVHAATVGTGVLCFDGKAPGIRDWWPGVDRVDCPECLTVLGAS